MECSLTALEAIINDWRARAPTAGQGAALAPEVKALATVYALMIYHRRSVLDTATLDPFTRGVLEAALQSR